MMLVLLLVAALVLPGGPLAENPETERYVSPWCGRQLSISPFSKIIDSH
jgi:hypothetical protein